MAAATRRTPLARYLFSRLSQNNVDTLFGVPGDFTLKALDHVKPTVSGLRWVGNCNELNAGYAADGYARIRGLGALLTTHGVGELSALNAIAGSYAEHVPVVHVVGKPSSRLLSASPPRYVHHSLADRDRVDVYAGMAAKVTAAQVKLQDAETAPEMVDWVIGEALRLSRPVYVELPSDMVDVEVTDRTKTAQKSTTKWIGSNGKQSFNDQVAEEQAKMLVERLLAAKRPLLLIDRGMGVDGLRPEIERLVHESGVPTLCLPSGAGIVSNDQLNYYGVHSGPAGQIDTNPYVHSADFIIAVGPMFSDTQTVGWKTVPDQANMVILGKNSVDDVAADTKNVLEKMIPNLGKVRELNVNSETMRHPKNLLRSDGQKMTVPMVVADKEKTLEEPITQTSIYRRLNRFLRPKDVVLLGNATPIIGGRDFILPKDSRAVVSGMWFSIGHMLPAALGVACANLKESEMEGGPRTILVEGDGNIQMTVQEISTIVRERLDVTIFIVQNQGYAYERLIHGLDEPYNDLAPWRYLDAASFFGAPDDYPVARHQIKTWGDLERLLDDENFNRAKGLRLVELVLDKYDVPEKFKTIFQTAGENL